MANLTQSQKMLFLIVEVGQFKFLLIIKLKSETPPSPKNTTICLIIQVLNKFFFFQTNQQEISIISNSRLYYKVIYTSICCTLMFCPKPLKARETRYTVMNKMHIRSQLKFTTTSLDTSLRLIIHTYIIVQNLIKEPFIYHFTIYI